MSSKGAYTAIYNSIVDAEDFRALDANERFMVYTLKLMLGSSGIDVLRRALDQLVDVTALDYNEAATALDGLAERGWFRHQGDVLWLVNGLRHNPNLSLENENHRKSVIKHVGGLPARQISNAFAKAYDLDVAPFPGMGSEWVANAYGDPVHSRQYTEYSNCSVSNETGASPVVENSELQWGDFAGWFRTGGYVTLWGGPTPPRDAPRDWTVNNDLSIAKRLSGKTSLETIRGVIEAGVWSEKTQSFERDRGITLAWYADRDDPERWAIAVGKYEIRQLPMGKKSRRGGLEKIEVELGGAV